MKIRGSRSSRSCSPCLLMRSAALHMTPAARFRIIVLLLLSLVSAVPDVFPEHGGHKVRIPESIHHENEIPEACKVSLGLETSVRSRRLRTQQPLFGEAVVIPIEKGAVTAVTVKEWIRPAYYSFLHRFSLF